MIAEAIEASTSEWKYTDNELGFVAYVVTQITGDPDSFELERRVDEGGVLITLRADKDHLGRIIGREGHTAGAIRNLLRALGLKDGARYRLKIEERL